MSLKIFHTGDIHLGMKFNSYGGEVKETLAEARFSSLESMIEKSNSLNADLFVIAGDLFNTIQVAKRDINRTVNILNKFNGAAVLVLPGNHDYDNGMTDLWIEFMKVPSEKIILLNEKRQYSLEDYYIDAVVYPAPCHSKHSSENSLGWIKEEGITGTSKYKIGIAHGAIEGLSADLEGNYYSMAMEELNNISVDAWLLGHTHVSYPLDEKIKDHKIFNPGTPEPDGLDFKEAGSAWYIELSDNLVEAEKIKTGKFRFFDKKFKIDEDNDLEKVGSWALEGQPKEKIVRLTLEGSLSDEVYGDLSQFYKKLESELFYLIVQDTDLKIKVDQEIIEKEFTRGSFPYEFLNRLIHDEEALQLAYDLIRRG